MTTLACYVLHYGREWLYYSIRSVAPAVDGFVFVYTGTPTFGYKSNLVCPEDQSQLYDIARKAVLESDGASWTWHDVSGMKFSNEGEHRTFAVNSCWKDGADMVLVVDADEIWAEDDLVDTLQDAYMLSARTYRVHMRHMWRSLHWICYDPAMPTRLIRHPDSSYVSDEEYLEAMPFHMGYAQSSELVRYKMSIHGHFAEIRPGWFDNIFMPWSPSNPYGDVHPTNEHFWDPVKYVDTGMVLHGLTQGHPYWDMELIP